VEEENDTGLDEIFNEGIMYLSSGNDADLKRAAELMMKASNNKHAAARRTIGFMYYYGRGVETDYKKAYEYISEAVVSLDPIAMYILGKMYEGGLGVEQSDREALNMFAFAVEMGIPGAEVDAKRIVGRIMERRERKLRSRPILDLEISDIDIEAVCCKKMFDSIMNDKIGLVDTYMGPELVMKDDDDMGVVIHACPFCGKHAKKVTVEKIYQSD
jgi:TPR repeat protein